MRPVPIALACALLLGGCVVAPDGSLAPVPPPGATIPPPAPPVAYAPPAYGYDGTAQPGVPIQVVPAPAPAPVLVAPSIGIGLGFGWGWGRGYWGRPYRRW
jgi:hypothetical protein